MKYYKSSQIIIKLPTNIYADTLKQIAAEEVLCINHLIGLICNFRVVFSIIIHLLIH